MRISLTLAFLCATGLASPVAQAPAKQAPLTSKASKPAAAVAPPTVEHILDRYVAALGGREAYRAVTSRIYRGTVKLKMAEEELPEGRVEILTKAPDRIRMTFDVKGVFIEEGFDGTTAWAFNSIDGGVRIRRGERAEKARLDAQFYEDEQLTGESEDVKVIGTGDVKGQRTHMVQAISKEGLKRVFHFSAASGLIVRIDDEVKESGRIDCHVTDLQGYRAVGRVKVPMVMMLKSPDMVLTINFTEVRENVPIDEARFRRPKAEPR